MAYPIKYIENNLVFNHDGECFAYYELLPYNYSFLSPEQKYQVHDSFRQLIAQNSQYLIVLVVSHYRENRTFGFVYPLRGLCHTPLSQ